MEKLIINSELTNIRLDKALTTILEGKSRSYISKMIEEDKVLVNGKIEKQSYKLTIKRGDDTQKVVVKPQMDRITKKYKIGVLIRDTVSGIGTITYVDPNTGKFGALGHTVGEDCEKIQTEGKLYNCSIVSVLNVVRGKAGELHGIFLGDGEFGTTQTLCECGIFGQINKNVDLSKLEKIEVESNIA